MTAMHAAGSHDLPEMTTDDRRTHVIEPSTAPKRRINDTLFNRLRWPVFIGIWFVVGLAVFVYLLRMLTGG